MKGSFAQGIKAFQANLETKLTAIVTKVVFDAHKQIILRSPVDTGRYRASNQINLNSLPDGSLLVFHKDGRIAIGKEMRDGKEFRPIKEEIDAGGVQTIEAGKQAINAFSLGDTIFLYNNVAYAVAIEEGHSQKQAPQGVYRITALEMIAQLQAYAKAGV